MKLSELQNHLALIPNNASPSIKLPNDQSVAPHFHLTEIGIESKDFIDCGGTRRQHQICVLQLLVGNDTDHRLFCDKFQKIVNSAQAPLELLPDTEVIVEITGPITIERYGIGKITHNAMFTLTSLSTACLASETCGLEPQYAKSSLPATSCCGPICC